MLAYAVDNPFLYKYIPNQQNPDDPHVDRRFVFNIINTVNPAYFPQQLKQLEEQRKAAAEAVK